MKNTLKVLGLAMLIVSLSSQANAGHFSGTASIGPGDEFNDVDLTMNGHMGPAMALVPTSAVGPFDTNLSDGALRGARQLALTAVPNGGPTTASALAAMPNNGQIISTASSGLTDGSVGGTCVAAGISSQFNDAMNCTKADNAFAYNNALIGPFQFGVGSAGDIPLTTAGGPQNAFTIDQVVGKYTASSSFDQRMVTGVLTNQTGSAERTSFTLQQGDEDMLNSGSGVRQALIIGMTTTTGGPFAPDGFANGDIVQQVQQDFGLGGFSSCMGCPGANDNFKTGPAGVNEPGIIASSVVHN